MDIADMSGEGRKDKSDTDPHNNAQDKPARQRKMANLHHLGNDR